MFINFVHFECLMTTKLFATICLACVCGRCVYAYKGSTSKENDRATDISIEIYVICN